MYNFSSSKITVNKYYSRQSKLKILIKVLRSPLISTHLTSSTVLKRLSLSLQTVVSEQFTFQLTPMSDRKYLRSATYLPNISLRLRRTSSRMPQPREKKSSLIVMRKSKEQKRTARSRNRANLRYWLLKSAYPWLTNRRKYWLLYSTNGSQQSVRKSKSASMRWLWSDCRSTIMASSRHSTQFYLSPRACFKRKTMINSWSSQLPRSMSA